MVYVYDVTRRVVFEEVRDDVVLLSPSLYWYKSCSIPTKNLAKAKNIAKHMMSERPARFSEVLLYKKDGLYDAYAYDKSFVKSLLRELNLKNPRVYFANQLEISEAVAIDDDYMLYAFGGRVMQSKIVDAKPTLELSSSYKEMLGGQKPVGDFLRSDRNITQMLLGVVALVALYVVLFSADKMMVLSGISESSAKLDSSSEVSFYEMQSLIKRYSAQERRATKLKAEMQKALENEGVASLVYEDAKIEIKNGK